MPIVKDELIEEIETYISENGGVESGYGWYFGITDDPRRQLFEKHRVNEHDAPWLYSDVDSLDKARALRDHFIGKGCKGGESTSGSEFSASPQAAPSTIFVYAYRISWYSEE